MPRLHAGLEPLPDRTPARRAVLVIALVLAACAPSPGTNRVLGRLPGHSWDGSVGQARYCPHCSNAGQITVDLGSHVSLITTTCFNDAKAKIGINQFDSHVELATGDTQVSAIEGKLEIEQCSPSHLRAKVWAQFADGGRVDATIDTYLAQEAPTP